MEEGGDRGTTDREAMRERAQSGKEEGGLEVGKGKMKNQCRG